MSNRTVTIDLGRLTEVSKLVSKIFNDANLTPVEVGAIFASLPFWTTKAEEHVRRRNDVQFAPRTIPVALVPLEITNEVIHEHVQHCAHCQQVAAEGLGKEKVVH